MLVKKIWVRVGSKDFINVGPLLPFLFCAFTVCFQGQSTKPSATKEEVERTKWPHLLQCKYHDM